MDNIPGVREYHSLVGFLVVSLQYRPVGKAYFSLPGPNVEAQ